MSLSLLEGPKDQLEDWLREGERLLWRGRPRPMALDSQGILLIGAALLWAGLRWLTGAGELGLVLILLMATPLKVFELWRRSRTEYGLTATRALILERTWKVDAESVELRWVRDLKLLEGRAGVGSIVFGESHPPGAPPDDRDQDGHPIDPQFYRIPDVRSVYDLIVEARRAMR